MKISMRFAMPLLFAAPLTVACSAADTPNDPSEPMDDEIAAWDEAYEENASGKADGAGCSGVIVPDQSGFHKRIALTFDDGPHLTNTPQVLDILAAHGATATFFVNGKSVRSQAHRDLMVEMHAEGHLIGNHSQNHHNMRNLSTSRVRSEIEQTHDILVSLDLDPSFFRFPYGSSSCTTADLVRSYGYAVTGWHIDSADWCYGASRGGVGYCSPSTFRHVPDSYRGDIAGYVLSQAHSKGGGVLLFHDVHSYTVSQLDNILTRLENEGFTFVGLDDVDTFPRLNGSRPQETPFIGSSCGDDTECDFSASGEDGFCTTYDGGGFCSLGCEGYCPDRYGAAPTFCVAFDGPNGVSGGCVSKASAENGYCGDLPGTTPTSVDRYVGSSGVSNATAEVCLPVASY